MLASCHKADESLARSPHWNCIGRWQETWKLEQPMLICMVQQACYVQVPKKSQVSNES
jgi:hypothetical protein